MRAAALTLLLVGCGSHDVLDVSVTRDHVILSLQDADCHCSNTPLLLGECRTWDDLVSADDCVCSQTCDGLSSSREDGVLVVEGCGNRATFALPESWPAAPRFVLGAPLAWEVDPLTVTIQVGNTGGFAGMSCRGRIGDVLPLSTAGREVSAYAEWEMVVSDTAFGETRFTPRSGPTIQRFP